MTSEFHTLAGIEAIVFDVIGTLVDEETTFANTAERLAVHSNIEDASGLHRRWSQLLEEKMDDVVRGRTAWRPHSELVAESGCEAIRGCGGILTPILTPILAGVDREYPAWPDVTDGMRALRMGRLLVGLSNGDLSSLAWLAARNDLPWHVVLSTAAAKTFKPAEAAYRVATDSLALNPAQTLFVAAHPWDLRAATKLGFRTAYLARPLAERALANDRFDLQVESVIELAQVLEASTSPRMSTAVENEAIDRSLPQ